MITDGDSAETLLAWTIILIDEPGGHDACSCGGIDHWASLIAPRVALLALR
jgi:hypothetical protein